MSIHILTNSYQTYDPRSGRAPCPVELDLGCGKGGLTLEMAARFPDRLVLGVDVMLGRLRRVERKVEQRGLANVELLRADNLDLVGYQLPDGCISRLHILCPDPWPKQRHRGRRLVTSEFLGRVARVLRPGGVLHLSTDEADYIRFMQEAIAPLPWFRPADPAAALADVADIRTEFEAQWLAQGRTVPHLVFTRT